MREVGRKNEEVIHLREGGGGRDDARGHRIAGGNDTGTLSHERDHRLCARGCHDRGRREPAFGRHIKRILEQRPATHAMQRLGRIRPHAQGRPSSQDHPYGVGHSHLGSPEHAKSPKPLLPSGVTAPSP